MIFMKQSYFSKRDFIVCNVNSHKSQLPLQAICPSRKASATPDDGSKWAVTFTWGETILIRASVDVDAGTVLAINSD
jgi:hypothetical protein